MKILFNCLTLEKGGAERVITTIANELIKKNDITILTLKKSDVMYKVDNKIKILTVDKKNYHLCNKITNKLKKFSIIRLFKMKKIVLNEKPDVIISFLPEPSLRIAFLKKVSRKINKIPTIISIRNDPNVEYHNFLLRKITKHLYSKINGFVFQTNDAKGYFKALLKREDNMVVIPNPINGRFLVDKYFDGERKKEIVTVGRLEKQKNHMLLIDAFYDFSKKYNDYKLYIYGDGSLKEDLKNHIKELKIGNKVFLMGQVDDVKKHIYDSSVFVLSSDYEGMPNALMEATALGIPCIATDCPCGGARDLINNNKNGILISPKCEKELYEAIVKIVDDSNLQLEFSKNGIENSKKYRIDKILILWEKIIEKITTRGE